MLTRSHSIIATLFFIAMCLFASQFCKADDKSEKFEGLLNRLLAPGPLILGHEDLEHTGCLKCHETGSGIPDKNCLACHKKIGEAVESKQGLHGHHSGKSCADCHADHKGREYSSTKIDRGSFNHADSGFVLDGSHTKVPCEKCHIETRKGKPTRPSDLRYFGTDASCRSCHAKDNIHKSSQKLGTGECSTCHNTQSFKIDKPFDHLKETGYPLAGHHKALDCKACHQTKDLKEKYRWPDLTSKRCLACHKDQHGNKLSAKFRGGKCDTCHNQEHWPISSFNHQLTSFELEGKHKQLDCIECHKQPPGVRVTDTKSFGWTSLQPSCASCHKSPHSQAFLKKNGSRCEKCHGTQSWQIATGAAAGAKFSHNTTGFPLTGKHNAIACQQCHLKNGKEIYKFPNLAKKSCLLCHQSPHNETFRKQFGSRCESCHGTDSFKNAKMPANTAGGTFSHDKTRFPLTGKHMSADCKQCHLKNGKEIYKFPDLPVKSCLLCHQSSHSTAFLKKFGSKCTSCHNTEKWEDAVLPGTALSGSFSHDKTRFPLTGQHTEVSCKQCHNKDGKEVYRFSQTRGEFCGSCHTNVHMQQFRKDFSEKACTSCHTTKTFARRKPMNHDETGFILTGAHKKIATDCTQCHVKTKQLLPTTPPKPASKFIFNNDPAKRCAECHANEHVDMFHRKFYTESCQTCHTTDSFSSRVRFDHNSCAFALKGKHTKVACVACHQQTERHYAEAPKDHKGQYIFKALQKKQCATCHKDPHKGANGPLCQQCHTEEGWKTKTASKDFHKDFTLTGAHLSLSCDQCHGKSQLLLKGTSDKCFVCHHHQDPHRGALPACEDCHSQIVWNFTRFDHNMTAFPLKGAHRVASCDTCHRGGVYQGLPTGCADCHFRDTQKVKSPDHTGAAFQNCELCHNEFAF